MLCRHVTLVVEGFDLPAETFIDALFEPVATMPRLAGRWNPVR